MYNELHPSRKNPIDLEAKIKVENGLAERRDNQRERLKKRKEELRKKMGLEEDKRSFNVSILLY